MRRIRCSEVLGGATLNIIDHRSSAINHRPSGRDEGAQVVVTGGMAQAVCACSAACHHASSFKLPASAALGPRASRPIPAGACAGLRTCCWMEQSAGGGGARSSLAAPPDGRQPAGACPACPRVTHGWCGPRARSCRGETRVCVFQVGMVPSVVAEAGCPRRGPAGAASRTARGEGGATTTTRAAGSTGDNASGRRAAAWRALLGRVRRAQCAGRAPRLSLQQMRERIGCQKPVQTRVVQCRQAGAGCR